MTKTSKSKIKKDPKTETINHSTQSVQRGSLANNASNNTLLLPLSIILTGLIITISILYGTSVLLDRDEIVTKKDLRTVIREELAKINTTNNANNIVQTPPPPPSISESKRQELLNNQKIVIGNKDAPVNIVEIADPSCPYCSIVAGNEKFLSNTQFSNITPPIPEIKKLVEKGQANYVWIYFPGAGNGDVTAQVFYCANEKNKFFEVHDRLMKGEGYDISTTKLQNKVENIQVVLDYIKDIVDVNFIRECVTSDKYKQTLSEDIKLSSSIGATGTPNFFINGEFVQGLDYKTSFLPLIRKYIQLDD